MGEQLMAIVGVGYRQYIMPVDEAVALAKTMARAEIYHSKYRPKEEGGTTPHVYPKHQLHLITLQPLSYQTHLNPYLPGKPYG